MTLPVPENQPNAAIFRLHTHPQPTHPTPTQKNKQKTKTNKQTKQPIYLHIMENNFEIVRGVRPIRNYSPSTGKTNLCHNILITQPSEPTKNICLHGKLFLREKAERLRHPQGRQKIVKRGK